MFITLDLMLLHFHILTKQEGFRQMKTVDKNKFSLIKITLKIAIFACEHVGIIV